MKQHLLKFSDFALGKNLEENEDFRYKLMKSGLISVDPKNKVTAPTKGSTRNIPKKFFTNHWIERTNYYGGLHYETSRIIEFNPESQKHGFTLKENLLDSNGNPIENLNLEDVLKGTWVDSKTLKGEYLPIIFQHIARNDKFETFMRAQAKRKVGLKSEWCAFLGKICLKKGGQNFFLEFVRGDKYTTNRSIGGGTFWGAGENHSQESNNQIIAMTPLYLPTGKFDDEKYVEKLKKLIAQNIKAKEHGGFVHNVNLLIAVDQTEIQLVFPLGRSFHVTIDLDKNELDYNQIIRGFKEQINLAYDKRYKNVFKENPVVDLAPNPDQTKNEKKLNLLSFSEFLAEKNTLNRGNNPCWPGYRQVGLKKKNGRSVPNCVPVKN